MRTITGLMEAEVGGDTLNCTLKTWFGRLKTGWAESESTKQQRKRLNKQLARSKLPRQHDSGARRQILASERDYTGPRSYHTLTSVNQR